MVARIPIDRPDEREPATSAPATSAAGTSEAERLEPLIPRWAVWIYVSSPPLLSLLLHPELFEMDPGELARSLLATWLHTVAIGASLHLLYARVVPRALRDFRAVVPHRLVVHAAAITFGTAAGLAVSVPLTYVTCDWGPRRPLWQLYTALVIASCFVLAMVTYTKLRRRARDVERRAHEAERAALKARLASLTARTDPHFLFNSLNTVAGLIGEDPVRAEEAVERLAALFRYTLDATRRARVPLAEELAAVQAYLDMESLRFEGLCCTLSCDAEVAALEVPPLVVQPLVDNAIRHGIAGRGSGRVAVSATRGADHVAIRVVDDGPGFGRSGRVGSGTSLDDLRQRLELVYGASASLDVDRDGPGCTVTLRLPAGSP